MTFFALGAKWENGFWGRLTNRCSANWQERIHPHPILPFGKADGGKCMKILINWMCIHPFGNGFVKIEQSIRYEEPGTHFVGFQFLGDFNLGSLREQGFSN